ncbi:microtubule organization protein AKNA isoform X2 [Coregonus clupeaformis]|uniref:microtubule organization protein AKNA isoform X2 n=1 Tax=Coregonus clupeaformis TaxID=59861 RepID=UPI001E1C9A88|nr:microtubule organization protein AKNA isoform X2 [Coregonus clupeaformis]
MEPKGQRTRAGVLFWTPAPQRPSPSRSIGSEVDWGEEEEEDEEGWDRKTEEEEGFHTQMDENGIIGLDEALDDVGLGGEEEEEEGEGGGEENPPWYSGALEGSLSPSRAGGMGLELGLEHVDPLEELSYNPSELQDSEPLSQSEPPGEDTHTLSLYPSLSPSLSLLDDDVQESKDSVEIWSEDEEQQQKDEEEQSWVVHRQRREYLPERDRQLDMTEDEREVEEDGEEEEEEEDSVPHADTDMMVYPVIAGAGPGWGQGLSVRGEERVKEEREVSAISSYSADLQIEETSELSESDNRGGERFVESVSENLSSLSPPDLLCSSPQSLSSPPRSSTFPHLLHFSSEELAYAPGIEAETFPEDPTFTESLPESRSSRMSNAPRPHWPLESGGEELKPRTSPYPAAISPECVISYQLSERNERGGESSQDGSGVNHRQHPYPRTIRQRLCDTPQAMARSSQKSWHAPSQSPLHSSTKDWSLRTPRESPPKPQPKSHDPDMDEGRRGPLTYPTPDFSKVEPRVRFPKSGYTPPKSKGSPRKRSLSVEPPLVFKSPADIVREVLLSSTDGPQSPSPPNGPHRPLNSTVPEDFRCPQQASTLVQQLQEDYNRLLTKYAEAENTIDRMRLQAKVGLYSDPPKPSHTVQSGVLHEGSKVMTLTFPQAQRAELSSDSVYLNGQAAHQGHSGVSPVCPSSAASSSPRSLGPGVGEQLTRDLSKQAERFLQQVQTFEELLRRGKLKPFEQMKSLSQLLQGQDSLERGYLAARDEHRLLLQSGAKLGPFDPGRELEGCIFQCGMRVEELKEQVEQTEQDRPTSEAPPTPPPHPTPYSMPAGGSEPMPLPESPVLPLPGESGGVVGVEVSSASGESEGEEGGMGEEEVMPPLLLRPLRHKHKCVERDLSMLMDHYQSFRELPRLLDLDLTEGDHDSPDAGEEATHSGGEGTREGPHPWTGREKGHTSLPQRQPMLGQQDATFIPTARPRTSKSVPPSPKDLSQSPAFHDLLANDRKRSEVRKSRGSSLTSLGESAASERRGSKLQPGTRRVPSQDGIISPETDSGFVGSESSRLTPAAPSPLHQRAIASLSVPEEQSSGKPHHTAPVSGQPIPSSSSPSHRPQRPPLLEHSEDSGLSTPRRVRGSSGRTRGGERKGTSASSSPQHRASRTPQPWDGSGTSEFGPDSDHIHSVSGEDEARSDRSTRTTQHRYQPSPSPTAPYHHGDPLRALSSGQLTNRNEAIQSLQAEVGRLKERLESSLRQTNPPSPVRAPPSAHDDHTHPLSSTPRTRSVQRRRDGGREESREERRWGEEQQVEERASRLTPRRSASVPRQRPDLDINSEHAQSTPRLQSSRRIPVSPATWGGSRGRAETVRNRGAHTRQHVSMSVGGDGGEKPDCRGRQDPVCPQCSPQTHTHGHSTRPEGGGGDTGAIHSHTGLHSLHCPMCGRSETYRSTSTKHDRRTERDSGPAHRGSRPMSSPHRDVRGVLFAAPPPPVLGSVPLVQFVPVCPPVLYYSSPVLNVAPSHPQPIYVSLGGGVATGVRGHHEQVRGGAGRSLSADQRSLSSSLNHAIEAARGMRESSRRMARSIATGLHHQEALSQSCMY